MVDYAMDIHKSLYQTEDVPQGSPFLSLLCIHLLFNTSINLGFMCRYGGEESGGGGSVEVIGGGSCSFSQFFAEPECSSGVEGW